MQLVAAAKWLQLCPTVRPHRRQPSRLPRPWDSPGKNTGVGCHFLLQCTKVKSESEVLQSCLTLSDLMDCNLPGSSVHGFSRQEYWSGVPLPSLMTNLDSKCTGMTQRDGTGREEGGGFRMGNTCTPMADSCQCMTKPIQYCKVISLQLK